MSDSRPLILVTNDDGFSAPGIRNLVEAMKDLGRVVVIAPEKPQSGMGHAITIDSPLRLQRIKEFGDVEAYACSGTPADCVKLAKDQVLHRRPDLCVSGINHGPNSSINVIYSGTMSAAIEAAIEDIPAIVFSLMDWSYNADFSAARVVAGNIARETMERGIPPATLLNVNIPAIPAADIRGVKICRQATAKWVEEFDRRKDPRGREYYWLTGRFENFDKGEDTDEWALANGFVSIVPTQFDLTAHHAIPLMNERWELRADLAQTRHASSK
jgi:5'-nucleotidase